MPMVSRPDSVDFSDGSERSEMVDKQVL